MTWAFSASGGVTSYLYRREEKRREKKRRLHPRTASPLDLVMRLRLVLSRDKGVHLLDFLRLFRDDMFGK